MKFWLVVSSGLVGSLGLFACSDGAKLSKVSSAPGGLDWSGIPTFAAPLSEVKPYTGDDPVVLEAQSELPNAAEFHRKVVLRSCGPLEGVCHNQKEYPDMHTPYNFLGVIDAPCNVQSGTLEGVYDRCERYGDRFSLGDGPQSEIGWTEWIPQEGDGEVAPSETMPGLHIHLADPIEVGDAADQVARFTRSFVQDGEVKDISYYRLEATFHSFDDGKHIVATVPDYRIDDLNGLLQVGIEQGDLNRNGIFGARPNEAGEVRGPVSLLVRGDPETSYLIARLRGHMEGEPVPGSRMPLANPPFSVPEMLALFCFVEGLPAEGAVALESPIDYAGCSYISAAEQKGLEVEGSGTGFKERIAPLLEANCGGCHSAERAEGDLVLVGAGLYDAIVSKKAAHDPLGRNYVTPGKPAESYLYLKLTGDSTIDGKAMPLDPIAGTRTLAEAELNDIAGWIEGGASP